MPFRAPCRLPQFSVPHPLLGKHESQINGSKYRTDCTDHSSSKGYHCCGSKTIQLEYFYIVLKLKTMRQKIYFTTCTQIVCTDRVDDQIVKRISTNDSKDSKNQNIDYLKCAVSFLVLIFICPLNHQLDQCKRSECKW